jgi:diguanylate cyclase (GGDEF)-like protein
MKQTYFYILISLISLCLASLILQKHGFDLDAFEELFWFTCTGLLIVYGAKYVHNQFLIVAWGIYCLGLFLDVLDDIFSREEFPFLLADTSLKKFGLILTCMVLYKVIDNERRIIKKLNNEIQHRKKLEDKLSFDANHDHLTQLGNRKACFDNFQALVKKYPYILYLDLDSFKHANDKFGHQTGDKVLQLVSESISSEFGSENCFRLGGDEFVIFTEKQPDKIEQLRERLLENIFEFSVGVSIGVAKADPRLSPDENLHNADESMYNDKNHKIIRQSPRS